MRTDAEWLQGLDTADDSIVGDLLDYLRRSLAKGFAHQLAEQDLEDLAQSSLVKVLEKRSSFAGRSAFTTWATAIAVNLALQLIRKRKFVHVSLDDAAAAGAALLQSPAAPERLDRAERDAALLQAIETVLTPRQRTALQAKLTGMPMAVIASRMGSSRGALYKLLHDARHRLRAHLESEGVTA